MIRPIHHLWKPKESAFGEDEWESCGCLPSKAKEIQTLINTLFGGEHKVLTGAVHGYFVGTNKFNINRASVFPFFQLTFLNSDLQ